MIRKIVMLALVVSLFCYTAWYFYGGAVAYDPLGGLAGGDRPAGRAAEETAAGDEPAWDSAIHEKNLFSPERTYREPKPVVAPPPRPKRPELALKGVVVDRHGEYVAYIVIDKAKPLAMRKGDKSGDVALVDVSEKRAVVKWYDEMIDLSMEKIKTIEPGKAAR